MPNQIRFAFLKDKSWSGAGKILSYKEARVEADRTPGRRDSGSWGGWGCRRGVCGIAVDSTSVSAKLPMPVG